MTTRSTRRLIDDELAHLLDLCHDVDSVELKLTVPDDTHRSTIAALDLDPLQAQIRQVYFLDTPELALDSVGVVARVRRIQGHDADAVVKLRPVVPDELPIGLRRSDDCVVEVDAMPGGFVCSASVSATVHDDAARAAISGRKRLSRLFSAEQRRFFDAHAPSDTGIDDLSVLGPVFVLKVKLAADTLPGRLVVEMWLYPDGSRILELSTKSSPSDALLSSIRLRRFFEERGIEIFGGQQTKTRTALDFYASELRAAASEDAQREAQR